MMRIGGAWPWANCGASTGAFDRCMTRIWIGLVWVRSTLRSPQRILGQEEGVVHLPRRVLGREVQAGEVVEVVLDVGPFGDRKTHFGEDGDDLVHHLHRRMHRALAPGRGGQGEVDALGGKALVQRGGVERGLALGDGGGDAVAQAVDQRALHPPLVGAHRAQGLEQVGDFAGLAERGDAHGLQRRRIGCGGDLGGEIGFEGGKVGHRAFFSSAHSRESGNPGVLSGDAGKGACQKKKPGSPLSRG